MTPNAIRVAGLAIILLALATLTGCTAPYATVELKPFPADAPHPELVDPDYFQIQDALTIINSILLNHGYYTETGWVNGGSTSKGWYFARSYFHKKPSVDVFVTSAGTKQPNAVSQITGKPSVWIQVDFRQPDRWFLKVHPDVIKVQSEIAQELTKRFGEAQVTTTNGRAAVTIQ